MSFGDVFTLHAEIRTKLLWRSCLYCIGMLFFYGALKRLNIAVAVLALHTGLIILTCILRVLALKQLFFAVTISKLKAAIILLEFGAIPGLTVVDMD